MDFESEMARRLFLKYATPCGKIYVKRRLMDKKYFNNLIDAVANEKEIPQGTESTFKLALETCSKAAKTLGKNRIDEEAIRQSFWFDHDAIAKKRHELMRDFKLEECIVYPGEVNSINRRALINTPVTTKFYRIDFVPDLGIGYNVTVHYDFVVEVIPKKDAQTLWRLKG